MSDLKNTEKAIRKTFEDILSSNESGDKYGRVWYR